MSSYIKLSTMEYPRHQGDIRLEYPEMGYDFICPDSYAFVVEVSPPEINHEEQTCYEGFPQQINGQWTMVWEVRNLTDDEKIQRAEFLKRVLPNYQQDLAASGTAPDVI